VKTEILKYAAAALGQEIEYGQVDPRELTEGYLAEIDASGDGMAVYARITRERAMAEASAAAERAKAGLRRGRLDGVPISWKDLFDSAGTKTEAGSALLKGRTPKADALVLARATRAGLVCLGKTHMTELAFSGLGLNPVTSTPPNSIAPELAPGGSSSGAAVSVGLGMAAAGIGSDTGGSVRIPSAWNDLIGLKTTHGLLSLDGVVPLCPLFDTVGPLCRSVEDAALLLAIMADDRPADLTGADIAGAKIAICETSAFDECDAGIITAFEDATERLTSAGAIIEIVAMPEVAEALSLSAVLFSTEAYASWGARIEEAPDLMFPPVRERFRSGREHDGVSYVRAWQRLHELRQIFNARLESYQAILVPTSPNLPPDREKLLADQSYFAQQNLLALRNTRIGNLMGGCAITVPTGERHCGIMALGGPGADKEILRIGAGIERALSS